MYITPKWKEETGSEERGHRVSMVAAGPADRSALERFSGSEPPGSAASAFLSLSADGWGERWLFACLILHLI